MWKTQKAREALLSIAERLTNLIGEFDQALFASDSSLLKRILEFDTLISLSHLILRCNQNRQVALDLRKLINTVTPGTYSNESYESIYALRNDLLIALYEEAFDLPSTARSKRK